MTAVAGRYGVSASTLSAYLRKHGVVERFDGWRTEQYDRLLGKIGRASYDVIAAALRCTVEEVAHRISTLAENLQRNGLSLVQISIVTGVDRAYWSRYIKQGWVSTQMRVRAVRVSLDELRRLATERPELFNYRSLPLELASTLGMATLQDPPRYKLVTCRSQSLQKHLVEVPAAGDEGAIRYEVCSCAELGGVDFWVPTYAIPACPRCGIRTSRFSEKRQYADTPGDGEQVQDAMAKKIGLRWKAGQFHDQAGRPMTMEAVRHWVERLTAGNSREWLRKSQLVDDIEHYRVDDGANL